MAKKKIKKPQYPKKPQYHSDVSAKTIIGSFAVVIVFVVFGIMFMDALFAMPKTPATADEVWAVIEAQGYEPKDIAEYYYEDDYRFRLTLLKCIGFEKDDIHFEFFEFNNKEDAQDIYGSAHHKIITTQNSWQKIETDTKIKNYCIYTIDSLGKYSVAIYVGNTAVYAYSNSENKYEINKILDKIDYLQSGNNKKVTTTT